VFLETFTSLQVFQIKVEDDKVFITYHIFMTRFLKAFIMFSFDFV